MTEATIMVALVLYQGRGIELIIDLAKQLPQFSFQIIGGEKRILKN